MAVQRKALSAGGILFVLLILVAAAAISWMVSGSLGVKKVKLEKTISYLKSEYRFAQIRLHSRSGQRMAFSLVLYNMDGNVAVQKDFNLEGNDVFLESKVVVVEILDQEKSFIFPEKLYTDVIPQAAGIGLDEFYVKDGFPLNYKMAVTDQDFVSTVKSIYSYARSAESANPSLDNLSIKVVLNMDAVLHQNSARELRAGTAYDCVVHPNGGLELAEVKE